MDILIIEDEGIVALDIAAKMTAKGYTVCGIAGSGTEALVMAGERWPDLVLMDICLKGELDGVQTALLLNRMASVPIIFLTALSDRETWQRAVKALPAAYIVKPFREEDLHRTIELALLQAAKQPLSLVPEGGNEDIFPLKDRMFVRVGSGHFEKILNDDILYFEAERAYCVIVTKHKRLTLSVSLNKLLAKVPAKHMVRVHKSYAVNLHNVDGIADQELLIAQAHIPVGQQYRPLVQKYFPLLK
ncbi:MAG: response regulator [Chitinophagaceae bacterium]|nr:response regulator [Chitinophagaceae bacterium]